MKLSWFFEKINKIDEPFDILAWVKRMQINNFRDEKGDIITGPENLDNHKVIL